MPRVSHEPTLARQWELLKLLPTRRPGATARDLRNKLEEAGHTVTKRTVERDLLTLSVIFPIETNEKSKPYGWHWFPHAQINFPGIDLAEAVSLGLLEDLLRQLIPPAFLQALEGRFSAARAKLAALPQNSHAQWSDLVRYVPPGQPLLNPVINPEVLTNVQDALLRRRQLQVSYAAFQTGSPRELLLHPLALIQQGGRSYLLATTFSYQLPVYYALHRLQSAAVLAETAHRPDGFSLTSFLACGGAQFGPQNEIKLKAVLGEDLAAILQETALSTDQTITHRDGKIILSATVRESWQLHFWILSQGASITILQPAALKKSIITRLQAALTNYAAT